MFSPEFKVAMMNEVFKDNDGASLHDAIYEATNKSLNDDELRKFFMDDLDEDLQILALQWGLSDTQFREDVYHCLVKKKIVLPYNMGC